MGKVTVTNSGGGGTYTGSKSAGLGGASKNPLKVPVWTSRAVQREMKDILPAGVMDAGADLYGGAVDLYEDTFSTPGYGGAPVAEEPSTADTLMSWAPYALAAAAAAYLLWKK